MQPHNLTVVLRLIKKVEGGYSVTRHKKLHAAVQLSIGLAKHTLHFVSHNES